MKHNAVQILVKSPDADFNKNEVSIDYTGVTLNTVHRLDNGKYLALDVTISPQAQPGTVPILFQQGHKTQKINWLLKERNTGKLAQGVTSEDLIYLIMPDRFSNGSHSNDRIKGLRDQSLNRDSIYLRHGGDLQGIINHLDYLQELGVTTLWLTPIWQNDMPNRTEHGYAITNHYQVDPRLGNNAIYKKLSDELHNRNMKLIQDAVYNHVGLYHFFAQDKPTPDWFHEFSTYTNTTFKDQPLMDPHAAVADQKRMSNGWFTPFMPDLNQNNPFVAEFLIQHALWSVEEFGVDGWRIDTYIYNDLAFMNRCNQALFDEYPNITLFGETWVHGTAAQAYFARNTLNVGFKSNLTGVTDFQTNLYGIANALNEPFGWTNGVNKLYQTLAADFLYEDPMTNVVFLDNHDMTRFYSTVNEDLAKHKMGIAWLLTCRGIPQLYYGTEILMKGVSDPDGWVRLDFPGGWTGDTANKFMASGRTVAENEAFEWTRKLAQFRKTSSALRTGKLTQYAPEDGVYVYFRHDDRQTVMCVMNTNDKPVTIAPARFTERIGKGTQGQEVVSGNVHNLTKPVEIPPRYVMVMALR